MTLNVNILFPQLDQLTALVARLFPAADAAVLQALEAQMSRIDDDVAALKTEVQAAAQRARQTSDALNARIASLQAQVDAGTATAETIATLESLIPIAQGIDPSNPATLPAEGSGPSPTPADGTPADGVAEPAPSPPPPA